MSIPSPPRMAAMRSAESDYSDWARPRRQTNPDVVRRPSVLLRQATRQSADISTIAHPSPDQRPRTSGSAAHSSASASSTTVTPIKRNSATSHRSSLSASALSNPALAEIPSRKYNALRLSAGSAESPLPADPRDSNNNIHSQAGNVQCAVSRDVAAKSDIIVPPSAAANAPATSGSPMSPQFISSYSRNNRLPSEAPSPSLKRAPPSRTSLGIETPNGSLPASSSFPDRLVRPYSKQVTPQSTNSEPKFNSPSLDAVLRRGTVSKKADSPAEPESPARRRGSTPLSPRSSTARNRMAFPALEDRAVNTSDQQTVDDVKDSSTDGSRSRSDDVFLNIAKSSVSSRRESLGKLDRRRKLGLSTRSSLAKEQTPSPEQLKYQSSPLFLQENSPLLASNYPTAASAHPLDDTSRTRYLNASSASRSVIGIPRSRYNRETSPELPQTFADVRSTITDARLRHSNITNLSSRTLRPPSTSDAVDKASPEAEKARTDGTTESSLSTTAPSTVWDELDDLKSRIRKLELTGKFPSSSAAAMSNVSSERPRTAATTATTLSSSPKQKHVRKTSLSLELAPTPSPNPIQTLLHSALARAKTAVGTEVYGVLETTATDALTLANMLGSTTTLVPSGTVSSVNGSGISERQAKRKADSLCRSLTELCLALSEEQTLCRQEYQPQTHDSVRPSSRDRSNQMVSTDNGDAISTVSTRFRRSMSHEPESLDLQDSASQISSRLDTRRASTIHLGTSGRRDRLSHDEKFSPQTPSLTTPISRLSRLSGSHRLNREDDSDDRSSVFSRTVSSRAMTEVGGYSASRLSNPRERPTRDYGNETSSTRISTSYQPQQPRSSPSVPSTVSQRRSYATPATSGIPTAPGINIQPGFRRYGASSTVGSSDRHTSESPPQAVEPVPAIPQTRITVPSSKLATSYTAIQQPRVRTESFGTRRLGMRPRPSAAGQDSDH